MPGREQRAGPGLPGGPPTGGPDGRVQALLAEPPLDHGQGHGRAAMAVGAGDQPRGPVNQPRLDLRGDQERHQPGVGRGLVREIDREVDRESGGQLDQLGVRPRWCGSGRGTGGIDGAHADVLCGGPRRTAGGWPRERRVECRTRGPARAGGSPQRVGGAGRRARGHAQDPFRLGVRRGSRPRMAFRCGMAPGRVPLRARRVKPAAPLSDRNQPVALWLPDRPGGWRCLGYLPDEFGAYVPRCTAFRHPTSA
jgi:hypothetical protein